MLMLMGSYLQKRSGLTQENNSGRRLGHGWFFLNTLFWRPWQWVVLKSSDSGMSSRRDVNTLGAYLPQRVRSERRRLELNNMKLKKSARVYL